MKVLRRLFAMGGAKPHGALRIESQERVVTIRKVGDTVRIVTREAYGYRLATMYVSQTPRGAA